MVREWLLSQEIADEAIALNKYHRKLLNDNNPCTETDYEEFSRRVKELFLHISLYQPSQWKTKLK